VWGTIGYFIVVVAVPPLLHAMRALLGVEVEAGGPSEPGLEWMFYVAAVLTVLGALTSLGLPKRAALAVKAERGDFRALLAEPAFVRLLIFNTGIQLCLHGPMVLFPLYVRSRGGSMTDLSYLWVCMLVLEVPLIFASGKLFARFGVTQVMIAAAAAGGARWTICALTPSLMYVYPVQALHALVVTGLGVGTAMHAERIVPPRLRSTAQSSVVMVGASIGGVLSTILGGYVVDHAGVDTLFLVGGLGGLGWAVWARHLLRHDHHHQPHHQRAASNPEPGSLST
jgi:PPP family 3-phenylpropionic acid transporter